MEEIYEVRNWFEGRTILFTRDLAAAVAELAKHADDEKVGMGRVRDGASWEGDRFGRRLFTERGDGLRLEMAAERMPRN